MSFPFGTSTPATGTTGSLFSPSAAQPNTSTFSFGTPSATTATPTSTGSFFSAPSAPTATTGTYSFGAGSAPSSMFGAPTPGPSAPSSMTPFSSAQGSGALLSQNPLEELEQIARQWDPNSVYCQFRHVFYNIVPPQYVLALRERRPEKFPEKLWQYALQNVPDPQCMIPVQAIGFKELKLRVAEQDKMRAQHVQALNNIQALIGQVQRVHELETTVKLDQYRRTQMSLAQRVIRVMKKKELLATQSWHRSSAEQYKQRCEALARELHKPHQYKALLHDLVATVSMQQAVQSEERARYSAEPLDEETQDKVALFLSEQRQGLKVIMDLLTTDLKLLQGIAEQLAEHESGASSAPGPAPAPKHY